MSKGYEQRKEANKRYLSKFDVIKVRVPKGKKDYYAKYVSDNNYSSLNSFIIKCIEDKIGSQ